MTEALAHSKTEEKRERHLRLTGPATEVKERQSTEAFRTNHIVSNLPEEPSDTRSGMVFLVAAKRPSA